MSGFTAGVKRGLNLVSHPVLFAASLILAFLLRFDFDVPAAERIYLIRGLWLAIPIKLAVFYSFRMHRLCWKSVDMLELVRVFYATALSTALLAAAAWLWMGASFPRSIYFLDFQICFLATAAVRFLLRIYKEFGRSFRPRENAKRILIYGASSAGAQLAREIRSNETLPYEVAGFIDDEQRKLGERLAGVPVVGTGRQIAQIVGAQAKAGRPISEIIIAMPAATGAEMREALAHCRSAEITCKTLPGIGEMLSGQVLSSQIRDLSLTDLLGRDPVRIEEDRIEQDLCGRAVMVTGGAGSIGSELCRQIATFGPSVLVIFDQAESDLFRIHGELVKKHPTLKIDPVLGDIRDPERVDETIRRHRIDSIFHAAAYKHVPMMESHPIEAIRNNVFGTYNLAHAAHANNVSSFLMISSDKAINPTNVMGTTKRVGELLLSTMPQNRTRFVSVRFGNVLGSNGSVIPTFQAQIAAGGPVQVTHPDIRRYFMTIPEAVQLVLLASTMGRGSEVFVLEMGEPIKIVDLARQMIRLAGLVPGKDIQIEFTGLRPGEKLFEELTASNETILATDQPKIKVMRGATPDSAHMQRWLAELRALTEERKERQIVAHLRKMVPEFTPDGRWDQPAVPLPPLSFPVEPMRTARAAGAGK